MQSRLKGNPISCPKIRKRIGHVTRRTKCRCAFEFAPNHYPTPVLHLETLPADKQPDAADRTDEAADPQTLARRYGVLDRQRREIDQQWREMHEALCGLLRDRDDRALQCDEGRYVLAEQEGVETLVWVPNDRDEAAGVSTVASQPSAEPAEAD